MACFISHRGDNFLHSSFWWLFHVFTLIIRPSTFLVIIKPISTYKMTILATKIIKIGQLGPEIWLFSPYGISTKFSPRSFSWLTHVFTPSVHSCTILVIIISISTYELTIIATKIMKIGQLGPEIWLFSHFISLQNSRLWVFHGYSIFSPQVSTQGRFWSS